MKSRITLKAIAKELGVSISTVSKALHNHKDISLENRRRIQNYAREHNYQPNSVALNLKNRHTRKIGVIIPEIVHYFFSEVIAGIEEIVQENGYQVLIGVSNESVIREAFNLDMMLSSGVDGFLISLSKETFRNQERAHLDNLLEEGVPMVMFDRVMEQLMCHQVIIDDYESGYRSAMHLLERGCRRILIISTEDYLRIGNLRSKGAQKAIQEWGMEWDEKLELPVDYREGLLENSKFMEEQIGGVFDAFPDIDGVFCVNEVAAFTALNIAIDRGKRIPEDLQIIGFSNGILSKLSRPQLTTVDQHGKEIGRKAAQVLIDQLKTDSQPEVFSKYLVHTDILERSSTRPGAEGEGESSGS